jgi:hypothetical protein
LCNSLFDLVSSGRNQPTALASQFVLGKGDLPAYSTQALAVDMLTTSRVLLCFATALIVSATAYICAWLNYRNIESHSQVRVMTRQTLELLRKEIEAHKERTGDWPARLTDLKVVQEKEFRVDEAGDPVDSWGNPFQYRIKGDGFLLYSHGRDGQPGGVGLDADLYVGQPDPQLEPSSLWEFSNKKESRPVKIICIFVGLLAFPLCMLPAKGQPEKRLSLAWFLLRLGVTAFFAFLAALVMSLLHLIPSGH